MPALYLVATPIGNLEDISLRALRTLKEVNLIAAEDTRRTKQLLSKYDIATPITSYHEHNKRVKLGYLMDFLATGDIAVVSDAGMPGISDPGEILIREAINRNVEVVILPGATAFASALVISGLDTHKFVFEGFLAHKKNERTRELEKLKGERRTMIFYESPHRLKETLKIMLKTLGDRNISISREITKKFEEIIRGKVGDVLEKFKQKSPKGEVVVVIAGSSQDTQRERGS